MHILLWYAQPYKSMQVFEVIYWQLSGIHVFTSTLDSCSLPTLASEPHILYINWGSVVMGMVIITLLINQSLSSSDLKMWLQCVLISYKLHCKQKSSWS